MFQRRTRCFFAVALVATLVVGCDQTPQVVAPTAAVGNVADNDVTEHVKTALQQDGSLKGSDIQVVTLKGDVRLIGVLERQAQIDQAIKIARAAEGAHTIHDELTVKKPLGSFPSP